MKKTLLTFMAAALCMMTATAQQPRTILYEEFTGENCGPCAAANPTNDALMVTNAGKILKISYMEPVPTSGFFYTSVQTLNDARYGCSTAGYYNPIWGALGECFTPSNFLDGHLPDSTSGAPCGNCGNVAAFTQADITAESAITSPFIINAVHYFNAAKDSVFGTVGIKAVAPVGGNSLMLRAVFVRSMNFTSPPGDNGEMDFKNVARAMYPSESGQAIASSWAIGTTHVYTYSGKCANLDALTGVTTVDSNFFVWVQNDSAAESPITTAPYPDARFRVLQAAQSVYTTHANALGVQETTNTIDLNLYPNPANETTTLSFDLVQPSTIEIKVIDQLGRTVKSVPVQNMNAGAQNIAIATGNLPSGLYSVLLRTNETTVTRKLSIVR